MIRRLKKKSVDGLDPALVNNEVVNESLLVSCQNDSELPIVSNQPDQVSSQAISRSFSVSDEDHDITKSMVSSHASDVSVSSPVPPEAFSDLHL